MPLISARSPAKAKPSSQSVLKPSISIQIDHRGRASTERDAPVASPSFASEFLVIIPPVVASPIRLSSLLIDIQRSVEAEWEPKQIRRRHRICRPFYYAAK